MSAVGRQKSTRGELPCRHDLRVAIRGASGLLLVLGAVWSFTGGNALLHRALWMDEVHSWLLITDPDVDHALRALRDGADYNPPGYFLVARLIAFMPGGITEFRLRFFSLALTASGLLGLYLLLCRRFPRPASAAAVVATAGHTLLIHQATEVRFYAAWFAALVWMCWLIDAGPPTVADDQMPDQGRASAALRTCRTAAAMLLAAFVCVCHYFGILSVTLVVAGLLISGRNRQAAIVSGLIFLSGLLSVASCRGMLQSQRAALSRPTWISAPTISASLEFLQAVSPVLVLAMLLAALTVKLWCCRRGGAEVTLRLTSAVRSVCFPLAFLPVVLIGFSWTVQPALVARYATVGLAGFAPLIAGLVAVARPALQRVWFLAAVILMAFAVPRAVAPWQQLDTELRALAAAVSHLNETLPADTPVIFEDRAVWLPLVHRCPQLAERCRLVDFETPQLAQDSDLRIVQRDVGRRLARWYPRCRMFPLEELSAQPEFLVVTYHGGRPDDLHYPVNYVVRPLFADCFRFSAAHRGGPRTAWPSGNKLSVRAGSATTEESGQSPNLERTKGNFENLLTAGFQDLGLDREQFQWLSDAISGLPARRIMKSKLCVAGLLFCGGRKAAVTSPALPGQNVRGFANDQVRKQHQEVSGL